LKKSHSNLCKVYINSRIVGYCENGKELESKLKEAKRKGELPFDSSIVYNPQTNEVHIFTDRGRLLRPLIVVKDGKPLLTEKHIKLLEEKKITFWDLVKEGIIEFIDAYEEETAYVAPNVESLTKEHTHLEIHPMLMISLNNSAVPAIEKMAGARCIYAAKHVAQAIGWPGRNVHYNYISEYNAFLWYPQRPIVSTKTFDLVGMNELPNGTNLIVAVMSWMGYNIADALIVNKASLERGALRMFWFKIYEESEKVYPGGLKSKIQKPPEDMIVDEEAYSKIEEDGLPIPGTEVEPNDVIIGSISPPRFAEGYSTGAEQYEDSSIRVRHDIYDPAYVDRVLITNDESGNKLVRVKLRLVRKGELGDKMTTRNAQKGVIGLILPPEEMPYTEDGIVPDIILNVHAIPSRMTANTLFELLCTKYSTLAGKYTDVSPFGKVDIKEVEEVLLKNGYRKDGKEVLYHPWTGEPLKASIFIGPNYYYRNYKVVSESLQFRGRGKVTLLTRQPVEGKARGGGLRVGEMEKDTFVAHGASMTVYERLVESSDKYKILICPKCGTYVNTYRAGKPYCAVCNNTELVEVEIPYAMKLLIEEMMSLGIYVKFKTSKKF